MLTALSGRTEKLERLAIEMWTLELPGRRGPPNTFLRLRFPLRAEGLLAGVPLARGKLALYDLGPYSEKWLTLEWKPHALHAGLCPASVRTALSRSEVSAVGAHTESSAAT